MLYNPERKSFHSVNSDEFLPPISRWTSLAGIFLVGSVAAAIALSSFIKYNVKVKAAATVRPIGEVRLVHAEMEGTVKSLLVRENQLVKQGDAIAYLDQEQLQIQKKQLLNNIQQRKLQQTQIAAQISALDTQILAESESINRAIAAAQADLERQQQERQQQLLTTQADLQVAKVALELSKDEMARYQQLVQAGVISQLQFKEKESDVKSASARLEKVKAVVNPSLATVTIAQERVAQENARGEANIAALKKEKQTLIQQEIEIKNQISQAQTEIKQIEIQLQKSTLVATSDGIILKLNLRNPGQVVRASEPIAEIAPVNAPLVIKAMIATQDIEKVAVGQKVQLRVDACPYPDYGTLSGIVSSISPDAIAPQNNSAAPYFDVTIQPQSVSLGSGNRQCCIQSGMDATDDIISKEETAWQFVLRKARLIVDL
ncbi:HlyD family efflux transporter periplasmic adaptor subunit [Gloeocapsopsis crepidinum LEGE 06123]|uniref:HlyD family efflux transporter periplasmic adaptor subunit n=1 Tax=Gloeocapsopsis crepidinum LEGE 06123 TaxID=588587 RepID=A0ABR9UMV7_9CHRO|nr:HlyD family efflux transporter periplasmic adaptor subunit [Gloeocapsopsis crepidinum]MBE9189626.1 HlyD family efflux transporter periplasmic adaptor subunit [Gloeocapsopsis crepidinum LEGE 06123]